MLTLGLILAFAGYIAGLNWLAILGVLLALYGAVRHYRGDDEDRHPPWPTSNENAQPSRWKAA